MIDIIIPVYNSSKTLIGTLNSIMNQTMVDKFNVYLVDDASDEDYTDIYNLFSKYFNLKILHLKTNSGPGVARQYGLDHSKGEYIVFIDSDDSFYDNDSVEVLYNNIKDFDIAFGKMYYECFDTNTYHEGCLHGKMYRRSFIEKNDIKFNKYRSHEDNAFNQICLSKARINYIDRVIYSYNYNEKSITNTEDRINSLKTYIDSMSYAFKKIETFKEINALNVGTFIFQTILYIYMNYLDDPKAYEFVFDKASYLKSMYHKYSKYLKPEDIRYIYNNFNFSIVPFITLDEFIDKIKNED